MSFSENTVAEFLMLKGARGEPRADLPGRSAALERLMHSTMVLLMRSSPAIRLEGVGARVAARICAILSKRERERDRRPAG